MRKTLTAMTLSGSLALGACSSEPAPAPEQTSADQVADKLEQAADQSDPKAAEVMNKRADELRGSGAVAPPGQPGSYAQDTMQEAGAAAAETGAPAKQP
jgi:hypothetical protein